MFLVALVALIAVAVAILVVLILLWEGYFGNSPRFGYGLFGILLLLFIIFFIVRVAFMGVRIAHYGGGGGGGANWNGPRSGRGDPALRAARMRYARGEITREQFEQIRNDLLRQRPPPPGGF